MVKSTQHKIELVWLKSWTNVKWAVHPSYALFRWLHLKVYPSRAIEQASTYLTDIPNEALADS